MGSSEMIAKYGYRINKWQSVRGKKELCDQ